MRSAHVALSSPIVAAAANNLKNKKIFKKCKKIKNNKNKKEKWRHRHVLVRVSEFGWGFRRGGLFLHYPCEMYNVWNITFFYRLTSSTHTTFDIIYLNFSLMMAQYELKRLCSRFKLQRLLHQINSIIQ